GIGRDPVGESPLPAVEQVGGDDLVVVVGGMGEGAAAGAVAHRPDPRYVGLQLVVDRDVAARVGRDAGLVEPEVVGVGGAADRHQEVRGVDLRRPFAAFGGDGDAVAVPLHRDALGVQPNLDALGGQDLLHLRRDVGILARDQPVAHLDHRDLAAEAAIHL